MTNVWTPKERPVILDKFSHLSLDAQKVMASMYRDFHIKTAEIKAATFGHNTGTQWNQIETLKTARSSKPENHGMKNNRGLCNSSDTLPQHVAAVSEQHLSYDKLYREKHGGSIPNEDTVDKYSKETEPSVSDHRGLYNASHTLPQHMAVVSEQHLSYNKMYREKQNNESIPMVDTVDKNSKEIEPFSGNYNYSGISSPPVETKDYEILSQFHLVDTQADLFSDSPCSDDGETILMTKKSISDSDLTYMSDTAINKSLQEHIDKNLPSTSFDCCTGNVNSFSLIDSNNSGLQMLKINEGNSACSKQTPIGLLKSGLSNSVKYTVAELTNNEREEPHISKEKCHQSSGITNKIKKGLSLEQNGHTGFILNDGMKMRKELLGDNDLCEENPFLDKVPEEHNQLYTTPIVKCSSVDEPSQKLKQTKIIFERIGSEGQGNEKKKLGCKHFIDDDSFEIQGNKKKAKFSSKVQESTDTENITYIDKLSTGVVDMVCNKILQSVELVLCLVYTNGATQFRDNLFNVDNKKKGVGKIKNEMEVAYIALGVTVPQINHVYMFSMTDQRNIGKLREFWLTLLRNDGIRKIGFQIKNVYLALFSSYNYDFDKVDLTWTVMDAGIGVWLLDPDQSVSDFEHLLLRLNLPQQTPSKSSIDALQDDMNLLSEAMKKLFQMLQCKDMWNLFLCLETKLVNVLAGMERRKMSLSIHTLLHFSTVLKRNLTSLEEQAHISAGHAFLLSSHHQLRQVLFEELKLDSYLAGKSKLAKTNVTREISTSETVLTQLSPFHPLPGILLEYRQLQKLKSTYIDGILSCVDDSFLTTHWEQTSAATGRLSSHHPNIQAIPKLPVTIKDHQTNFIVGKRNSDDDIEGMVQFNARDVFISRPEWSLLSADFQQIELRLLGHLASDPVLLKIFSDTTVPDIFNALAAQWMGKAVDNVSDADREQTKRVVYSVMYGIGKEKLAGYLKCTPNTAKAIMTSFLLKFPAVNQFTKSCVEFCQKYGYTRTIFKRRRLFPNIKHRNSALRAQAERQCVNFCVQGSAADVCKAAMLQVENALASSPDIKARLLVQIHDEILLEVADSDFNTVSGLVTSVMESEKLCGSVVSLKVPLPVSISVGKTWGQMQPVSFTCKDC